MSHMPLVLQTFSSVLFFFFFFYSFRLASNTKKGGLYNNLILTLLYPNDYFPAAAAALTSPFYTIPAYLLNTRSLMLDCLGPWICCVIY